MLRRRGHARRGRESRAFLVIGIRYRAEADRIEPVSRQRVGGRKDCQSHVVGKKTDCCRRRINCQIIRTARCNAGSGRINCQTVCVAAGLGSVGCVVIRKRPRAGIASGPAVEIVCGKTRNVVSGRALRPADVPAALVAVVGSAPGMASIIVMLWLVLLKAR